MTSTCVMTSVPRFASACLPAGRDGVARAAARHARVATRDTRPPPPPLASTQEARPADPSC